MNEVINIGNNKLQVKTWNGQRVITFKDIDMVHERPDGTASRNFRENRKYFILDEDYFVLKPADIQSDEFRLSGIGKEAINNRGTYFITEIGYMMIAKSLTDELAWKVQRQLVNTYFKFKEVVHNFNTNFPIDTNALNSFLVEEMKNKPCLYAQINNIENTLESVVDNMTLSTRQQEKIHEAARNRINMLLGGAHTSNYKRNARSYMINLWNNLKSKYHCGSSYKDLHPSDFEDAVAYIRNWEYKE